MEAHRTVTAGDPALERPWRSLIHWSEGSGLDHMRALYVQTPATLVGYLLAIAVVTAVYAPLAERGRLWGWLGAVMALWLLRLLHYLRYLRDPAADEARLLAWRRSWRVLVVLQGSMWGIAVWLFWGLGTPYDKVALILVVYGICVSSVQLLATQAWVFLSFISLVLTPTIVRIATDTSESGHLALAVIVTVLFGATVLMARTHLTALGQAISLKERTDQLAAQLRTEVAATEEARRLAEEARRAAEAANRAKTQFFAAASHDLRQPLHAVGLFAEALRQRSHDPEVASLVNSINESVDALEGLFGELLDITRIDTGGVDVNPAPVRMRELFARLRLHFEPIAFEKGLMLSFRGEPHVAHADPVLLERVLRNLVSNAIRYTDDGGVLVSCRLRKRPGGRQAAAAGLGHRHRHRRGQPTAHLGRVLPGPEQPAAAGAPPQGAGAGAGHRQAAGGPDGRADRRAVAGRPRHGVLDRGAAGQGAAQHRAGDGRRARAHRPDAAGPLLRRRRGRGRRARGPGRAAAGLGRARGRLRQRRDRARLGGRRRCAAASRRRNPTCCSSTTGCRRGRPASTR